MATRYTVHYSKDCPVVLSWYRGRLITSDDRLELALRDADFRIELPGASVVITDTRKGKVLAEGPNAVHMLLDGLFSNK